MAEIRLHVGQTVSLDGIRHHVMAVPVSQRIPPLPDGPQSENDENFTLRNLVTLRKTRLSNATLLELFARGRLRVLSFGEAFASVPGDELPIVVDDITTEREEDVTRLHFKVACVQALARLGTAQANRRRLRSTLQTIANQHSQSRIPCIQTIYKWKNSLRNWDGDPRALLPANARKGNFQRRLDAAVLAVIEAVIREGYLRPNPLNVRRLWEQVRVRLYEINIERETQKQPPLRTNVNYRTVQRLVERLDPYTVMRKQKGFIASERAFRRGGRKPLIDRPLQRVEVDHTQLDIYLVSDADHIPIGRPWLTAMIDVFSRSILGFHLGFRPPNQAAIAQCLRMAILPKNFLHTERHRYSLVHSDWPMHGIPCEIAHDAGKDFLGKGFSDACFQLGIQLNALPVLRPWLKGTVERFFGTVNTSFLNGIPGKTLGLDNSGLKDLKNYDPTKHAILPFGVFLNALTTWIVDIHHHTVHSATLETPLERWSREIENYPPRLPPSRELLDIWLGRNRKGSIRTSGIHCWSLTYQSEELLRYRAALGNDTNVVYRINDADLSRIFVFNHLEKRFMDVPNTNPEVCDGLDFYQFYQVRRLAGRIAGRGEKVFSGHILEARQRIDNAFVEASKTKKQVARRASAVYQGTSSAQQTQHEVAESPYAMPVEVSATTSADGDSSREPIKVKADRKPTASAAIPEFSAHDMSDEERAELAKKYERIANE